MGTWVVHITVVTHQAGIGTATLGYLLLAVPPRSDTFCSRRWQRLRRHAPVRAAERPPRTTPRHPRKHGPLQRGDGAARPLLQRLVACRCPRRTRLQQRLPRCLDDTHAVKVEHRYQRPIMSAVPATWSLGGPGLDRRRPHDFLGLAHRAQIHCYRRPRSRDLVPGRARPAAERRRRDSPQPATAKPASPAQRAGARRRRQLPRARRADPCCWGDPGVQGSTGVDPCRVPPSC
jgi:hypothetical protein